MQTNFIFPKTILLALTLLVVGNQQIRAEKKDTTLVVTPISKNVYSIVAPSFGLPTPENKGWNSNCHFVVANTGVLLFDTGSSESIGKKIKHAIASVTDLPVRWIVNSHSHADHWLGNAAFSETVEEIIASQPTINTMKQDGPGAVSFFSRITKGSIGATQLLYPTTVLDQNLKRNFGEVSVEFIFSNDGHSPGDVLMWLPKQKILFGGDVLSSDWMPIVTGHGNVLNFIRTLESVSQLHPKIVLTGHGIAGTGYLIQRDAALLTSVWKQVQSGIKNNKTVEDIMMDVRTKLGPKYKYLYKDFLEEIDRHVTLMYQVQS